MSVWWTPIGSLAISGRPVFETTLSTSGNSSSVRSMALVISIELSSDTLGRRTAWTARSPSSSLGTNSRPNREASTTLRANTATAATTSGSGNLSAKPSSGS